MAIDIRHIKAAKKSVGRESNHRAGSELFTFLNKDIHLFKKSISDKKKESFYSEMAILLSSGIDIRTSLEIIVEEQEQSVLKGMFQKVYDDIVGGQSLSEALYQTNQFTLYEYHSLRIGEESGKIKEVLTDLTLYYVKRIKQRRQLTGAFTYPVMVVITAIIAVFFMLRFIVPMFTEVFQRFKGELPPLTRFIINISDSFSVFFGFLVLLSATIAIVAWISRKKEWYRRNLSAFVLKLPVLGHITKKIYLARFCQSMALLLGSKTPMVRAIQLVRNMIGFYPFEQTMKGIEDDILHGKLLNQSMGQYSIFDKRLLALTRIAEEVNQLDKVFARLNTQYSEELEHQIGMIGNFLEPAMIIIVGLLVAVILFSMYLPLFQLSTSII